jgi:RNA polymerase sigma factor (sigma-70 family)
VADKGFLSVLRHVRSMVSAAHCPELSDQELLARFLAGRDDAAFTALVERHGPMVLAVCRRALRHPQDAEDACQATFLVLARSASSIRKHTALGSWLHGVAYRLSRKLKDGNVRRRGQEASVPASTSAGPESEASWREVQAVLDDELSRLPEKLRAPLVACYLEGQTRQEAAQRLGLPMSTLRGRLSQGRERLRQRLARRGVNLSAAFLVPVLAEGEGEAVAAAAVPPTLVVVTARTARAFATGQVSNRAATLANGWFHSMIATKFKIATAVILTLTVLAAGAGLAAVQVAPEAAPQTPVRGAEQAVNPAQPAADNKPRTDQFGDPLPAGSTLRLGTARYRQGTAIERLSVSADGKVAVATSGGHVHGAVRVFDLVTGVARTIVDGGRGIEEAVAVSPDGRILAAKSSDNAVRLFDAASGKKLRQLPLPKNDSAHTITGLLMFAPDGKSLAVTTVGETIHLVDVDNGTLLRSFKHKETLYAIAFSPDGTLLVAGGYDRDKSGYFARLWDVATGKELRRFANGRESLRTLAFSPDGKTLAGGGDDARLRLWNVETGKLLRAVAADGYRIRSVAFAPDGQTVAAAGDSVRLYDVATGKERLRIPRQAVGLSFSADGKVLTGAVMGAIYRWDPAAGQSLTPMAGDSCVDHLLASGDGRLIVSGGQDGDTHIWDAATGAHFKQLRTSPERGLALSPDGRFLVWPAEDETVKFEETGKPGWIHTGNRLRLYDIGADQFINRFPGFKGDAEDLSFTPDGKTLVTVDHRDGGVRVWDAASGKEQRFFRCDCATGAKEAEYSVWSTRLSPDGKTLAVTYQGGSNRGGFFSVHSVKLWDMATGKQLHELLGHAGYVEGLAFSPDIRILVTGSQALSAFAQGELNRPVNQLYVWDVASGKRVPALPDGLPDGAVCIAYGQDGRKVATANETGTIKIWEVATWKVRAELRGHRDRVNSLTFTTDGRLLSGGLDTTVLVWDMLAGR